MCETKKWPKIVVKVIFFFFDFETFAEYAKTILWTFQIKIQDINVVMLFKNTLKPPPPYFGSQILSFVLFKGRIITFAQECLILKI